MVVGRVILIYLISLCSSSFSWTKRCTDTYTRMYWAHHDHVDRQPPAKNNLYIFNRRIEFIILMNKIHFTKWSSHCDSVTIIMATSLPGCATWKWQHWMSHYHGDIRSCPAFLQITEKSEEYSWLFREYNWHTHIIGEEIFCGAGAMVNVYTLTRSSACCSGDSDRSLNVRSDDSAMILISH